MKVYTFVIGSMDDFEGIEDLMDYVEQEGFEGSLNYSVFEFECPDKCSEGIVGSIGRGIAFSNGWSMDDTFSFLVHGSIEEEGAQTETQLHDLWEL